MSHSPSRALDVGSVIADTYTIEGLIGRGGMGAVFVASHARLPGKKVAIKVLHPDVADAESLARFRREAEIASRLGHPNIVEVHDWNQLADGTPYLVLEFLQGESMADRLRRGPMSLAETLPILRQVGAALAAAHREGIVHRDLKPANIFLLPTEDGAARAKVLDFGISKIRGSSTVKTQDTQMLGTPQYMAPEQATGRHDDVDGRTDVFAFGAVVYEMLTGQPAFGGTSIPEVVFKVVYDPAPLVTGLAPSTPAHVAAAIDRALAKKSSDRWPDVSSFVEAMTGTPLSTSRGQIPPELRAPVDATVAAKSSTQDAYAATVGSGDHASAVATDVRAALKAGTAAVAATVAPAAGPPPRRTAALLALTAVIAAALAVAVVLIVGRSRKPSSTTAPTTIVDAHAIDAAVVPDAAAMVAPTDAGLEDAGTADAPPLDAGRPVDAAVRRSIDAGSPPTIDAGGDTTDGDTNNPPALQTAIQASRAALRDGDPDAALQITRAALNDFPTAQALFAIRAMAYCQNSDLAAAKAMMQRLKKPRLRREVTTACKRDGIQL